MERVLLRLEEDMVEKGNLGEVAPVGVPRQETVVVVGRVRGVGPGWVGMGLGGWS